MNFILNFLIQNNHYLSIIGIGIFLLTAYIFSNNKKHIRYSKILIALIMQITIGYLILNTDIGKRIFHKIALLFNQINIFAEDGIQFVFGNLVNPNMNWGYIFAIKVLPIIIFFGALMSLLYHLGVVQFFVKIINFFISPILGTSGAETLCATANSMLDPSASALLIKNQLKDMTDSEMLTVMIAGMATISAPLIAVYGSLGIPMLHLLTASVMSIPGSLLISKILIPETGSPQTAAGKKIKLEKDSKNILDAISSGTNSGMNVAFAVGAMLIVFIGLMSMVDFGIIKITTHFFKTAYNLNELLGKAFSSITHLIGISGNESVIAGALLGKKIVLNEFIAYAEMVKQTLNPRTIKILTYALCGFSNISVIGILIGSIGALVPSKRDFLTKYGFKALLGGTLVNLLNAAIASLII